MQLLLGHGTEPADEEIMLGLVSWSCREQAADTAILAITWPGSAWDQSTETVPTIKIALTLFDFVDFHWHPIPKEFDEKILVKVS